MEWNGLVLDLPSFYNQWTEISDGSENIFGMEFFIQLKLEINFMHNEDGGKITITKISNDGYVQGARIIFKVDSLKMFIKNITKLFDENKPKVSFFI